MIASVRLWTWHSLLAICVKHSYYDTVTLPGRYFDVNHCNAGVLLLGAIFAPVVFPQIFREFVLSPNTRWMDGWSSLV